MGKFMVKCVLLCSVLFIGVLIGMQRANEGMAGMKGYEDHALTAPVQITYDDNGETEATVLGHSVGSHDLQAKKEKLEEMKAYNFFSSIGKALAGAVTALVEKLVSVIAGFL